MRKYYVALTLLVGLWMTGILYYGYREFYVQEDPSWGVYCAKYGVNPHNPTEEEDNYYLDCYVGSTEEEEDMR